jgi:hypothetical protein
MALADGETYASATRFAARTRTRTRASTRRRIWVLDESLDWNVPHFMAPMHHRQFIEGLDNLFMKVKLGIIPFACAMSDSMTSANGVDCCTFNLTVHDAAEA